jgi:UDP-sulfoquinovose synthase
MKILILGADGYLGWPTCIHLSAHGHEVMAVDNYMRRNLSREQNSEPLFDVPNLHRRAELWHKKSGKNIDVRIGDLCDWDFVSSIFQEFKPDALIHYAEQPSAPYSMKDRATATLTFNNNLGVTFNIIQAVHEFVPDCHIVKLGTMGEYGTPNIDIEEGWLNVEHNGRSQKFLFPRAAGSLYHTTKVLDTDLLWFYVRTWGLRATDLMQGPVYGLETYENEGEESLYPFLNYDELFGTVINRFMVQAVAGYPLTVYGKGGQTRGFSTSRTHCSACVFRSRTRLTKVSCASSTSLSKRLASMTLPPSYKPPASAWASTSQSRTCPIPARKWRSTTTIRHTPACSNSA